MTITITDNGHDWWLVRFQYTDGTAQSFGFSSKADAYNACKMAGYTIANKIALQALDGIAN